MSKITNLFTRADQVCDKIPVVSTVSNLTDLFQKCVVMNFMSQQTIEGNAYLSHLQQKNSLRCFSLLFPIIGNIGCLIYDLFFQKTSPNSTPSSTPGLTPRSEDRLSPADPSYTTKKEGNQNANPPPIPLEESALSCPGSDELAPHPSSQEILSQEILEQLTNDPYKLLASIDTTLSSNEAFIRAAMKKVGGIAFDYIDPTLRSNREFMLNVIEQEGGAFIYAGSDLRKDQTFMLDAVERNPLAFVCFEKETQNSAEFRKQAETRNPDVVRHFILVTGFAQNNLTTKDAVDPKAVS